MSQDNVKYDEIKRKLRNLKKLEKKIRSTNNASKINNNKSLRASENTELVWDKFFNLKDDTTKKVKYSIIELSELQKDEFKNVISEYFYHVYYSYYKDSELSDYSDVDTELLIQLGIPIYADHAEIKRKFREIAKTYHPDNGGDSAKFIEIMEIYKNSKN